MKKCLALIVLLLLAACFDVDDFGDSWTQTALDPALAGQWLRTFNTGFDEQSTFPKGQSWVFTEKDGAYSVQVHRDGVADDEPGYPGRTLTLGTYTYFVLGPVKGSLIRYKLDGDKLTIYRLVYGTFWSFLRHKYPDATGFIKQGKGDAMVVKITHVDNRTLEVLENIPDNETYWVPSIILQQVKAAAPQEE